MMSIRTLLVLVALIGVSFSGVTYAECKFESPAKVIAIGKHHLFQFWDFSNSSVVGSGNHDIPIAILKYRALVQKNISADPIYLLNRYLNATPDPHDEFNIRYVLKNTRLIRPATCLDLLLLANQFRRTDDPAHFPTEFLATVLRRPGSRGLRVYYLTDDINGIRNLNELEQQIAEEVRNGAIALANIHNHSFFLNDIGSIDKLHPQGVLSPSANDIQVFRDDALTYQLRTARITNGFNSVVVPASLFSQLHASD